jgi:hypothetical protein
MTLLPHALHNPQPDYEHIKVGALVDPYFGAPLAEAATRLAPRKINVGNDYAGMANSFLNEAGKLAAAAFFRLMLPGGSEPLAPHRTVRRR